MPDGTDINTPNVDTPNVDTPSAVTSGAVTPNVDQQSAGVDYSSLINSDGTFSENFMSSLPDDLGSHSSLAGLSNLPDAIKSLVNAKSLVGKKAEEFMSSDDPSIVAERRKLQGMPDDISGYELSRPELSDGVSFDEGQMNEFKQLAFESGIDPATAQKLMQWDADRMTKAATDKDAMQAQSIESAREELTSEWGSNKIDYNLGKIKQATDFLGITDVLNQTGLANNPSVLKAVLDKIVPAISDDRLIESSQQNNFATIQDSLVDVENRMMKMDSKDPMYKGLMKEREGLLGKLS